MTSDTIEFFSPGIPPVTTQQESKIAVIRGQPRVYKPVKVREARSRLGSMVRSFAPKEPMDGPLSILVIWIFPLIKSTPRKDQESYLPLDRKPDTGNLNKALLDVLEAEGFYVNDSRIVSETTLKFRGPTPGIYVRLEPYNGVDKDIPKMILGQKS